jgi:hypothetical protein
MPETDRRHLKIGQRAETLSFRGHGFGKSKIYTRDRREHARFLQRQLSAIETQFEQQKRIRQEARLSTDFGLILNVDSEPDYPLDFTKLEKQPTRSTDGIVLLNVRTTQTSAGLRTSAAILVPYGLLEVLAKKVGDYANPAKDGRERRDGTRRPRNAALLNNISAIGVAALTALWTDPDPLPQNNELVWWEMWIRRDDQRCESVFDNECRRLQLVVKEPRLKLPDHIVVVVNARRPQIESALDFLNTLAEMRYAGECRLGLSELRGPDQRDWIEDAVNRIQWPNLNSSAVCLIDSGINRGHPLLAPILTEGDMNTVVPEHGKEDHLNPMRAHGTSMAGIAAFGDLRLLLMSTGPWSQNHRLESVKLIHTGDEHDPQNYGAVTQQAIVQPEISAPNRFRSYCLAITRPTPSDDGRPSSWSAAIDAAIAGSQEEDTVRRLLLVSAGNHRDFLNNYHYPNSNYASRIEDPAQSWNAITVGAVTDRCLIEEGDDESRRMRPVAASGGISPFSPTSITWEPRWPLKPEIVMEGGNLAVTEQREFVHRDSLELLTTASRFLERPLTTIHATSAATAAAARLCIQIRDAYPEVWPETVRGLMVHSARWTDTMLGPVDPHRAGSTGAVQRIIRIYGFGVPSFERALNSRDKEVTLICEDALKPYERRSSSGPASLRDCNLHSLPWPVEVLQDEPDASVTLRVTLSYFVDPNPGSRTWRNNPKYSYPGCLLRFRVKHKDQSVQQFRQAVERADEDDESESDDDSERFFDPGWAVGYKLRGKAGSLVQDVWKGTAAQLAEMGHVAVFPAKGWWATRKFPEGHEWHNCHDRRIHYSLLVSLEAEQQLPLYTAIENLIPVSAEIEV